MPRDWSNPHLNEHLRAEAKRHWQGNEFATREIARKLGCSPKWLRLEASRQGWGKRTYSWNWDPIKRALWRAKVYAGRAAKITNQQYTPRRAKALRTNADRMIAQKESLQLEESRRRDHTLYGEHLEDAIFLRRRGWAVTREKGAYRVGNRLVDADRLVAMAARERRLCSPPPAFLAYLENRA